METVVDAHHDEALVRDRLLSANEAAQLLGVSAYTIRQWARERRIPYYKVGRLLRFDADEIERWLGQQRRDPRPR